MKKAPRIPHNRPTIGEKEIAAVAEVMRSGWIAEGERVKQFETAVCRYLGLPAARAVAVSSGTAGLFLALHTLGVKKGSEVIMPSYVCSAVLNAVNMTGAKPVLVDINSADLNISLAETRKKLTKKTAAIIVTHTFGMPADVKPFKRFGVPVIEDCAQAIGARVGKRPVGTEGDIAVFSFYATKMLTTGYGGMLVSRDNKLIERARDYREFDGRRGYTPRFNFQMSDMQAALGLVQLARLPAFLKRREEIARMYANAVRGHALMWPHTKEGRTPNNYRILLRTKHAKALQKFLAARGISTIIPIERFELLHRYLEIDPKRFPVSEDAARNTLSLPAYPSLTEVQVGKICAVVQAYFNS